MTNKRPNKANVVRPRRKVSIAVCDVLFDLRGHGYRVISRDETPRLTEPNQRADVCIVVIDEEPDREPAGLTRRQREIARLLANRATNAEIAASLGISVHTAPHHSQRVPKKLGISSRVHVRN